METNRITKKEIQKIISDENMIIGYERYAIPKAGHGKAKVIILNNQGIKEAALYSNSEIKFHFFGF